MLYYFPHPSNLRIGRDVITMRRSEGATGYGIYVMILEIMRDSEGLRLYDDPDAIAFAINEDDIALVSRVCHDYSLFRLTDDGYLISPFLQFCQEQADERKSKAREWGRAGAKARYSRADQQQPSPSDAPNPDDLGPQPTPQHPAITYRVPIPPPMGTPSIDTTNQTKGEDKVKTNQPTKSKLATLEFAGVPGLDWLDMINDPDRIDDSNLMAILERKSDRAHNPALLVDWIRKYGMSRKLYKALEVASCSWMVGHPVTVALVAVLHHVQQTKYRPQHPGEYLISTAIKFYRNDV